MARDRQRAKQRQAERRARRQAGRPDTPPSVPGIDDQRAASPAPGILPDLAVGAPPEREGQSGFTGREEPIDDLDDVDPELEADAIEAGALASVDEREFGIDGVDPADDYAPRGRRARQDGAGHGKDRSRVVQFLVASWAELQRVQWPDRQALTTLTGVVLGFVLLMGGYLGLLDAVFSRIINSIL
ncbi:MAG TPA: preprotein translocase subunit SecE [Thermoleophilaceae bacterium]